MKPGLHGAPQDRKLFEPREKQGSPGIFFAPARRAGMLKEDGSL